MEQVTKFEVKENINARSHRKEKGGDYQTYKLVVFDKKRVSKYSDGFFEPVDVRVYYSNGLRVTACVWINDSEQGIHGSGSAAVGGGNYDKTAASVERAFDACGVEFNFGFGGSEQIPDALKAIARKLGYKQYTVIKSYR